jgi:hypothetical protein
MNHNIKSNLDFDKADLTAIPTAEAIQRVSASQAALNGSMQAAAIIAKQNIFDFLNL